LNVKYFYSTSECVTAIREEGREIWATNLSTNSTSLFQDSLKVPQKVAVIIGCEGEGCSEEILEKSDKVVYYPIYGFSESFNLSVAAALIMNRIFQLCPEARGNLTEEEKHIIRKDWYSKLAKNEERRNEYMTKYLNNPPPPIDDLRREDEERGGSYVSSDIRERILKKEIEQKEESENN